MRVGGRHWLRRSPISKIRKGLSIRCDDFATCYMTVTIKSSGREDLRSIVFCNVMAGRGFWRHGSF